MEGVITAIHGDVIEIEFSGVLPNINEGLIVEKPDKTEVILEVHDHSSHKTIKAIALGFTQGLKRGMTVKSLEDLFVSLYAKAVSVGSLIFSGNLLTASLP